MAFSTKTVFSTFASVYVVDFTKKSGALPPTDAKCMPPFRGGHTFASVRVGGKLHGFKN